MTRGIVTAMRKTHKKKLLLGRETVRALSSSMLARAMGGTSGTDTFESYQCTDNSHTWCPSYSDVNSCVAECGI